MKVDFLISNKEGMSIVSFGYTILFFFSSLNNDSAARLPISKAGLVMVVSEGANNTADGTFEKFIALTCPGIVNKNSLNALVD